MATKEQCAQVMIMLFGPASARVIENLSDVEAEKHCRTKVEGFFGKDKADEVFKNLE